MHELSLAHNVVAIVGEEAARHGLTSVEAITLRIGVLRAVVPELLQACMGHVCQGTVAEGARVEIEQLPGRARCSACGHEFPVEELLYACPSCGTLGGEILQGQELELAELEGD